MKKWLVILMLSLLPGLLIAQEEEENNPQAGKLVQRMKEYIQKNLGLSKNEAEKFSPVFLEYFREFAQTHRQFRQDRLVLQQKIIELRLRYRGEFRQIMDEQRANKVFHFEDKFRQEAIRIIRENRLHNKPPRGTRALLP